MHSVLLSMHIYIYSWKWAFVTVIFITCHNLRSANALCRSHNSLFCLFSFHIPKLIGGYFNPATLRVFISFSFFVHVIFLHSFYFVFG